MRLVINLLISTAAILIAAYLLPGVQVSGFLTAVIVAIVLAAVNIFLKPLLLFLTLPLNILTLGLFTFVVNAIIILIVSAVVAGFSVGGFWWALLFSLLVSLVTWALHSFK